MTEVRKSRWPDKYVDGGEWHRAWQKTLDCNYSVEAIRTFHNGDFSLYYAEMPKERLDGVLRVALAITKVAKAEAAKKEVQAKRVADTQYAGSIWLDLMLPAELAEDLHSNLAERFPKLVERHGMAWARIITNVQIARVIFGQFLTPAASLYSNIRSLF